MYKAYLLLLITFLPFCLIYAQGTNADNVAGIWLSAEKDGKVEVYKAGDKYKGRLIWMKTERDVNGSPVRDVNNPDVQLRNRAVLNIDILTGFTYVDGAWEDGKIYDPKTGKTYKAVLKIKNGNLELRCYTSIPMLGKTIVWQRVK